MHYKIGVTCVYNGHGFLYYVVLTWQCNQPISQFSSACNEFMSVWSMFVYNRKGEKYICRSYICTTVDIGFKSSHN